MDLTPLIIVTSSVAATLAVLLVFAAGWIAARRFGGEASVPTAHGQAPDIDGVAASRITMADVRERLRRLEAIAAGIDL